MGLKAIIGGVLAAGVGLGAWAHAGGGGEPQVTVELVGRSTRVQGVVDIQAPPDVVWAVIYDCAYAARLMEKLKSCRVLDRDPAGRWDVREHIIQPRIFPQVRMVMRSEYDAPRGVLFRQIEGNVGGQVGRWRLEPLDGGAATRAVYQNDIVLGLPVAGPVFRQALRTETPKGLARLKSTSEIHAKRPG